MDHSKALNIVSTLANGVNPTTGEYQERAKD